MDEQTVDQVVTIADLKTAFDQAVEEKKIIDAKIAEIKKQIQEQRKKYEDLDKKTDIYVADSQPSLPIDALIPGSVSINPTISGLAKNLFSGVVKYLIPIILLLSFVFAYIHRHF